MKFLTLTLLAGLATALPAAPAADPATAVAVRTIGEPCTYPIGKPCGTGEFCELIRKPCASLSCPGTCTKIKTASPAEEQVDTATAAAAAAPATAKEGEMCKFHIIDCEKGLFCFVRNCGLTPFCQGTCIKLPGSSS